MDGLAQGRQGEWVRPAEEDMPQLDSTAWVLHGVVAEDGSIVLPPRFTDELGMRPGDVAVLKMLQGGLLRVETLTQSVRRIQEHTRARVPPGTSMVDELIAERRREAEREND